MPICLGPMQPVVQFIIDAGQDVTQLALKRQGLAPLLTELGGLLPRSALQAIAPKLKVYSR